MHYEDEVWADLVRGTMDTATKASVEAHLASGCAECVRALSTWRMMASAASKERSFAPPQDIVRRIKQEFALQKPRQQEAGQTLLALLTFDSFAQPAPAGIRSAAEAARQMLYEADGVTIDLRIELQPPHSAMVVGQVLESKIAYPMPIPVVVLNEKGGPVMEMETTEFGEFQFEFDTRESLRVSFELTVSKRVQISLSNLQLLRK